MNADTKLWTGGKGLSFSFFLGALVLAMVTILTFVSLIPWATRAEVGRVEGQVHEHVMQPAHVESQRLHAIGIERLAQLDRRLTELNTGITQMNTTSDEILRLLHSRMDDGSPWAKKGGAK